MDKYKAQPFGATYPNIDFKTLSGSNMLDLGKNNILPQHSVTYLRNRWGLIFVIILT